MHSFSQIGRFFVGFYDYYLVIKWFKTINLLKLWHFPPETKQPWNIKSKGFLGLQLIGTSSSPFARKNRKKICVLLYFPFLSQTLSTYWAVVLKLLSSMRVLFPVQFWQMLHKILCATRWECLKKASEYFTKPRVQRASKGKKGWYNRVFLWFPGVMLQYDETRFYTWEFLWKWHWAQNKPIFIDCGDAWIFTVQYKHGYVSSGREVAYAKTSQKAP